MPNLEENLRYATSTTTLCISTFNPDHFFPILAHKSLAGCTLRNQTQQTSSYHYTLSCPGTNQTQGNAELTLAGTQLAGILSVRMGGKNMTFAQKIVATQVTPGEHSCPVNAQ